MNTDHMRSLHHSEDVRTRMVKRGYSSSIRIFHEPKHEFIKQMRDIIPETEAEQVYSRAEQAYGLLSQAAMAVMTAWPKGLPMDHRLRENEKDDRRQFEHIPHYQEIFGKLDYCTCPKCKSVFGPAAYFVDLMRIAGKYIILEDRPKAKFQAVPLKERRKDLWDLKLSCENTNEQIPYVAIVNRILEQYLVNDCKLQFHNCADQDRDAGVHHIYQEISKSCYPAVFPFCLPLEKARIWLSGKKLSLELFMGQWGVKRQEVIRESLKLSPRLYNMLQKPLDGAGLSELLGMQEKADPDKLKHVDTFLNQMQMSHMELYSLLEQDITEQEEDREERLRCLFINNIPGFNQYLRIEGEEIVNLNSSNLERITRFVRTARVLNLTYQELDWVLKIIDSGNDRIPLDQIWEILSCAALLQIDLMSVVSLFGPLKDFGGNPYAKIFGKTRREMEQIVKPEDRLHLVSEALGTDIGNLYLLQDYFGQEASVSEDTYYRHIMVARLLGIEVKQYIRLLCLMFEDQPQVFSPASAERICLFWKEKKIDLDIWYQIYCLHANRAKLYSEKTLQQQLSIDLESVHKVIEYMRKNLSSEERAEAKACKAYVFSQLSDYFDTNPKVLESLFYCALEPDEIDNLPEHILNDPDYLALDEQFKSMYAYLLLVQAGVPPQLLTTVCRHSDSFGISDRGKLNISDVRAIIRFLQYKEMWDDQDNRLDQFADEYDKKDFLLSEANNCGIGALAELTGWNQEQVKKLSEKFFPQDQIKPDILTFLDRISGAMYLLTRAALDADRAYTLIEIANLAFDQYETADELASGLIDALLDESSGAALEAAKRDALLPVVMNQLNRSYSDIKDYRMLYKYFLIDVEMDHKTLISPVKEGINALQLYLQRCRMHLESGIAQVAIPESWWLWMMDYTQWEANRKLFVYPENYLLPSLRHTKTSLFQNTESALEQARITDGYVEEQYIKYLDAYFDLTQLKICGAYETVEEYYNILYVFARTKQQPYTYYFCRKEGTLAWSEWEKIDAPIDSDIINPVYVFNRLHIFWSTVNEKEKVKLGDSAQLSADNQRAYMLGIKYTYKNLQGKWITPQTLVDNEIVYALESGEAWKESKKVSDQFGVYRQPDAFRKLTLLKLTRKNLKGAPQKRDDFECLAVITGSFSSNMEQQLEQISKDFKLDKEQEAFTEKLNRMIQNNNFEVGSVEDGYLNTGFFRIFNEELEEEHFFHKNEFIVVDGYIPAKNSRIYNVLHDPVHLAIGAYLSQSVLRDSAQVKSGLLPFKNNNGKETINRPKLTASSFMQLGEGESQTISKELSEKIYNRLKNQNVIDKDGYVDEWVLANSDLMEFLGSLLDSGLKDKRETSRILKIQDVLLKHVGAVYLFERAERAVVIPVVNQPGKFIYDCTDEAFLIYPVYTDGGKTIPIEFWNIDQGTQAGNPVTFNTFVKMGLQSDIAIHIMDALIAGRLADKDTGIIDIDSCTRERLEQSLALVDLKTKDTKDRKKLLDRIYGRLLNLPIISESQLDVTKGITGKEICNILLEHNILYEWDITKGIYRIDLQMMKKKTGVEFKNKNMGNATDQLLASIYNQLSAQVSAIRLNYRLNQDLPEAFTDQPFSDWKFGVQRLTNPTIKKLKRKLESGGVKAFLNRDTQSEPKTPVMPFSRLAPTPNVIGPKAADGTQIDFEGLYAEYNWELFYHIPMMIAYNLSAGTQHADSMKWFHYVFDPTKPPDEDLQKYYWNFFPFTQSEQETLKQILTDVSALKAYHDSPFDPHAVARLRIDAYAKYTVMEYVNNLIQWGDVYFVQNTWESLTSATMMYVWAADLLGPKPQEHRSKNQSKVRSFHEIEDFYAHDPEGIPQFIMDLEKELSEHWTEKTEFLDSQEITGNEPPYNDIRSYFGVPENEHILKLWDVVEDRLFKLRNSLDIHGVPRVTALFEPSKDPLGLVRQAARTGADVPGTLVNKPTRYPYRFTYMAAQAKSVTSQLIHLGNALNAALERQDSEALMALTSSQEQVVLKMGIESRENQLLEVKKEIEALEQNKASAKLRKDFYDHHVKEYISVKEQTAFDLEDESHVFRTLSGTLNFAAGEAHLLPQLGSPFAMKYGGMEIGEALRGMAAGYDTIAGMLTHVSQQSLTMAQYDRRKEDWELQRDLAQKELEILDIQLEAARLREQVASRELDLQKKSFEHKEEVLLFLKSKFTSAQLYQWLSGRLQSTMWQTYQLALELSSAAQESYACERDEEADCLKFDYWDSSRKGLTAGENLMLALQQMEQKYMKKNFRRLEIEKHISMAHTFPDELNQLKETGACQFTLGEKLFAADYPGCYRRKLSGLSISVPAVLPPYETVKATLKQIRSSILTEADPKGIAYLFGKETQAPDTVKACQRCGEKIAVSRGIDDSGMFVLNFQDERYLPFEGTGADSDWRLEMPAECNRFDMNTVSDIILSIRYTALEDEKRGSGSFYESVLNALRQQEKG